jgi:ParB/RepB/Spo0J family partition protein
MSSVVPLAAVPPPAPPPSALIAVALIDESGTNPRKHFDKTQLEELSASVAEYGVLEPLLVRKRNKGRYEVVAGARRLRAAKIIGLTEVPVMVCEFTDAEVFRVQLAENLDRADLTPLEEAEAFGTLRDEGNSVQEIARIVKRRTPEVAARLALLTLPKKVKDALASGLLPVGHAELIGRIPDKKLQEDALAKILRDWNEGDEGKKLVAPLPLAAARRLIEEQFMTSLENAPFDPEDADLSPLGACSTCPHRSGNAPDLFGDVKRKNLCTNPADFRLKTEKHLLRLKEAGYTVLVRKEEVKRAFPYADNPHHLSADYVDLERTCTFDPKNRSYESLLGRKGKLKTVFALVDGQVRRLYAAKEIRAALVDAGHAFAKEKKKQAAQAKNAARPSKSERAVAAAITGALEQEVARKLGTAKLTIAVWSELLAWGLVLAEGFRVEEVLRRHGFEGTKQEFAENRDKIVRKLLGDMSSGERLAFALDFIVGDFHDATANDAQRAYHKDLAKMLAIDAVKLAKQVADDVARAPKSDDAELEETEMPAAERKKKNQQK